jgi:hypothetical protein
VYVARAALRHAARRGNVDGWNLAALRVGAPYLPASADVPGASRDGPIDKTFDDTAWMYHLVIKGTNGRYDKSSVAIEVANELGLARDGDSPLRLRDAPRTRLHRPVFAFHWRDYRYFSSTRRRWTPASS